MTEPNWLSILLSQLWNAPYVMIYLVGIVVALACWRRNPSVSLCAFLGFVILLGNMLIGIGVHVAFVVSRDSSSFMQNMVVFRIVEIIRSLAAVVAYGLLITAIFGWRRND